MSIFHHIAGEIRQDGQPLSRADGLWLLDLTIEQWRAAQVAGDDAKERPLGRTARDLLSVLNRQTQWIGASSPTYKRT